MCCFSALFGSEKWPKSGLQFCGFFFFFFNYHKSDEATRPVDCRTKNEPKDSCTRVDEQSRRQIPWKDPFFAVEPKRKAKSMKSRKYVISSRMQGSLRLCADIAGAVDCDSRKQTQSNAKIQGKSFSSLFFSLSFLFCGSRLLASRFTATYYILGMIVTSQSQPTDPSSLPGYSVLFWPFGAAQFVFASFISRFLSPLQHTHNSRDSQPGASHTFLTHNCRERKKEREKEEGRSRIRGRGRGSGRQG